jgi:hypothetical protein
MHCTATRLRSSINVRMWKRPHSPSGRPRSPRSKPHQAGAPDAAAPRKFQGASPSANTLAPAASGPSAPVGVDHITTAPQSPTDSRSAGAFRSAPRSGGRSHASRAKPYSHGSNLSVSAGGHDRERPASKAPTPPLAAVLTSPPFWEIHLHEQLYLHRLVGCHRRIGDPDVHGILRGRRNPPTLSPRPVSQTATVPSIGRSNRTHYGHLLRSSKPDIAPLSFPRSRVVRQP